MTVELLDATTGELVDVMTEREARQITERIRVALDRVSTAWADLGERITEAYRRRADLALGYGSWSEYAEAELKPSEGIAADVRRQLVGMLSAQGVAPRAIAPVVGVTDRRVRQLRIEVEQGGSDFHPDQEPQGGGAPLRASGSPDVEPRDTGVGAPPAPRPAPVTGLDGKTYTRPEPKTDRRQPLTDTFWRVLYDTERKVEALARLTEDDRFKANRQSISDRNLAALKQTASTLARVLAAIESN